MRGREIKGKAIEQMKPTKRMPLEMKSKPKMEIRVSVVRKTSRPTARPRRS
jgi:hypothetical protein